VRGGLASLPVHDVETAFSIGEDSVDPTPDLPVPDQRVERHLDFPWPASPHCPPELPAKVREGNFGSASGSVNRSSSPMSRCWPNRSSSTGETRFRAAPGGPAGCGIGRRTWRASSSITASATVRNRQAGRAA